MACLSIGTDGGPFVVAADPIFLASKPEIRDGAEFIFEVLAENSARLKDLVGKVQCYYLDEVFWGRLDALESGVSAHPGLELRLGRQTLRGRMTILGGKVHRA